nr:MAG TPA: hypothetical protein [Bacteriophage sp.]
MFTLIKNYGSKYRYDNYCHNFDIFPEPTENSCQNHNLLFYIYNI